MSDPRRPHGSDPNQPGGSAPTERLGTPGQSYNIDPAYSGQYTYPAYTPPPQPTRELPRHWTQTHYQQPGPDAGPPPEPEPPGTPRWLWFVAGAVVLLVVGLVAALVIANGASKNDTVVAPLPPMPEPATTTTETPTPTTTRPPATTTTTAPTTTTEPPTTGAVPPTTTETTGTQTVDYSVTGPGRAISITYVDSGGVLQMEFNVALPWTKEAVLPAPATRSASVTVINVGNDVTCSISVDGTLMRQRTGQGLTLCTALR